MQQQHRALGALPRYADGGLIKQVKAGLNRLVGNNPEAMASRGRTEQIEPEPKQQQASYASGVKTKDNPAGIKFARGGKVKGPGTGTSDDVPIMASNGEYVIKAKAVQALGVKTLDALNAIADKDPHNGKKVRGARKLGAIPRMRDGGSVDEEVRRMQSTSRGVAPYVNHRAPRGAPAMQAPLQIGNSTPPANAVATQPYRPNFTMPGDGAPTRVVPESQASKVTDVRAKFNPANASPEAKAFMAERAANPGPQPAGAQSAAQPQPAKPAATTRLGQVAGRAGGAVRQAINSPVARAFVAPAAAASSAADTFETPTSDYETRFGFGPSTSDSPTVNLVRDIGVRALGAASDLGNTLTLGAAGQFYRDKQAKAGQLTPADPVPAQPGGAAPTAAPATAPATAPAQVAATAAPAQPLGRVTRVGNSYSGENVAGNVEFVDAAGNPRPAGGGFVGGTGDGTFRYGGASGQSGADQALHAARMAALQAGDIDAVRASYGGNFGGKTAGDAEIDALINNGRPMTARKLGAINKARADREAAAGSSEDRAMARTKGALDNKKTSLEIKAQESLLAAQDRLNGAKTEEERGRAMKELMALQGKYDKELPNRFTVVPGGQQIDQATGLAYTVPARVINNQTGQFVEQQATASAQNYETGKTYVDARGNRAKWDGKQFVAL